MKSQPDVRTRRTWTRFSLINKIPPQKNRAKNCHHQQPPQRRRKGKIFPAKYKVHAAVAAAIRIIDSSCTRVLSSESWSLKRGCGGKKSEFAAFCSTASKDYIRSESEKKGAAQRGINRTKLTLD
uniref:(northern house mosquito) hypothetical protein n=1 Tax=Culex pipiens TaxID=7175 RepID=A0A8D8F5U1_CULPI